MSKQSHTPGPWMLGGVTASHAHVFAKDLFGPGESGMVAKVTLSGTDFSEANAHLIAAAPEMLEALEFVLPALNANMDESEPEMQALLKAIAKARGES